MAVTQSVYNTDYQVGFPGMPFKQEVSNRISRTVEDAAGIGFGKAAFRGVGDNGCTGTPAGTVATPEGTVATFLGITIAHYSPKSNEASLLMEDKYQRYDGAAIMTLGSIWVTNGAAVVADGDAVFVTAAGAFTNVPTGNYSVRGWVFDKSAAAGAMVPIVRR